MQAENPIFLYLGIIAPIILTIAGFAIFYFGFKKPKDLNQKQATPDQATQHPAAQHSAPAQVQVQVQAQTKAPTAKSVREESSKLEKSLSKTRSSVLGRIQQIFSSKAQINDQDLEQIEEILYTSDLGPQSVQRLLEAIQEELKKAQNTNFETLRALLKKEMLELFESANTENSEASQNELSPLLKNLNLSKQKPSVVLVVGVNGAGKTTSIGKLAREAAQNNLKVLVAAGDTFRAAAGSQLKIWTDRAQVEIFAPEDVKDPSAVAYDACNMAKAREFDLVIIDTAGRLHTQKSLMEELKKMQRVIQKIIPDAPHETLLVLDSSAGQNALQQAREFHQALKVSGVILTKLDGTAKGGVAVGVVHELKLPIKWIGVGEQIDDIEVFDAQKFVDSII